METPIIKIGNSKGLRLPKSVLEKYGIKDKVELVLEEEQIIIRPVETPRKGWSEAFIEMHETGEDDLLIDDVFEDEDFES